jgi:hypothetical protein
VDLVFVTRDELPAGKKGRRTSPALVPWDELRAGLPGFEVNDYDHDLPFILMNYASAEEAPVEVVRYVHGLTGMKGKPQLLSADKVLDDDLMRPSEETA